MFENQTCGVKMNRQDSWALAGLPSRTIAVRRKRATNHLRVVAIPPSPVSPSSELWTVLPVRRANDTLRRTAEEPR
jgi:hypothetical protein